MAYDPYDPDAVADAENQAVVEAERTRAAWRWLLASPKGRRIVADLLAQSGYLRPSYCQGDALGTAYREGQRSVSVAVVGAIERVDPRAWSDIHRRLMPGRAKSDD